MRCGCGWFLWEDVACDLELFDDFVEICPELFKLGGDFLSFLLREGWGGVVQEIQELTILVLDLLGLGEEALDVF